MKAAISFLKSNNTPEETLRMIDNTDAEYLHVDVMDGLFVENKNFEPLDNADTSDEHAMFNASEVERIYFISK